MCEFRLKFHWSFVPKGLIDNIPGLVQIMAWRRTGDKPLSEPVITWLLTHICIIRPQRVNRTSFVANLRWFSFGQFWFQMHVTAIVMPLTSLWRHVMETLSTLLTLFLWGNLPDPGGSPHKWASTVELWCLLYVNSSPPSAACMRQWTGSALVQIMACRLFGAKPLPEPILIWFVANWTHVKKNQWNSNRNKWWPFCLRGDELTCVYTSGDGVIIGSWLVAYSAPSHHLDQCCHITNINQ